MWNTMLRHAIGATGEPAQLLTTGCAAFGPRLLSLHAAGSVATAATAFSLMSMRSLAAMHSSVCQMRNTRHRKYAAASMWASY
jgi:hypothetical protein